MDLEEGLMAWLPVSADDAWASDIGVTEAASARGRSG
jgi:hypothetical protein